MLKRDIKRQAALHEMQAYLDQHPDKFPDLQEGGARKYLDRVTADLDRVGRSQGTSAQRTKGERLAETKMADDLRTTFFRVLIDTGRMSKDKKMRAAVGSIPFPWRRINTTRLVIEARTAICVAEPWRKKLARLMGQKDFLDRFAAAADRLQAATGKKRRARGTRVGATRAVAACIKRARRVVGAVDALVRAKLPPGDPLIAEWDVPYRAFRSAERTKSRAKKNPLGRRDSNRRPP